MIFSQVSVSFLFGWVQCDHYPQCIGPHHTQTPSPLPLYRDPPALPPPFREPLALAPSPASDIWGPRKETCSDLFIWEPPPPCADIWLLLKDTRLASWRYTFYCFLKSALMTSSIFVGDDRVHVVTAGYRWVVHDVPPHWTQHLRSVPARRQHPWL